MMMMKEAKGKPASTAGDDQKLPAGFFDDIIQDTYARGLDPVKILKEDKERQARDLGTFFEEVGALDELEEAVEEDEELQRERNDKAVQMQYMVRLARLYNQADRINSSSAIPGRDIIGGGSSEIESEELIMGVGDYSTSLSEVDTQQISDSSTVVQVATKLTTLNTENDVFSIMKRQRLERKRRREISRADEDTNETEGTSAVYDWTSKSI